jgi:hypothetical protein
MLHDPHTAQWQPVETAPPDRQVCAARFENQTMTFLFTHFHQPVFGVRFSA